MTPIPPHRSHGATALAAFSSLLLYGVAALILMANWERIPATIPIHWGISGAPDHWAPRGFWSVYGVLIAGAAMSFVMSIVIWKGYQRKSAGVFVALSYAIALLFCYLALRPFLAPDDSLGKGFWVLLAVLVGLSITTAVGSVRDGMHERAANWKLGVFYYNPEDPAVWVAKRFGLGWTLNFAKPLSWVLLAVIAALPLVLILVR